MNGVLLLGKFQALLTNIRKNELIDGFFLWYRLQRYLKKNTDFTLKRIRFSDISREKLEKKFEANIRTGEINQTLAIAHILNKPLNHIEIENMLDVNIVNDACGCLFFLGLYEQEPKIEIVNFLQSKNAKKIIKKIIFVACEHSNFNALARLIKIAKNKDCNQEEIINLIIAELNIDKNVIYKFNWINWRTIVREKKLTHYEAIEFVASIIYKSFFT